LADRMSAWTLAWPKVALAVLILIGILGAVTSRRIRALRRASAAHESEFFRRREDPILKISLSFRIALVFAAVLLMNAIAGIAQHRRRGRGSWIGCSLAHPKQSVCIVDGKFGCRQLVADRYEWRIPDLMGDLELSRLGSLGMFRAGSIFPPS